MTGGEADLANGPSGARNVMKNVNVVRFHFHFLEFYHENHGKVLLLKEIDINISFLS